MDARTIFSEMKAQMDPEEELRVLEKALANSFTAGVEAALKAAIEADACVVCGGALLEEYPPYCEDTCRDGWHDYMDEHGDEHQGAVSRIRALLATRPTTLEGERD